MNSFLFVNCFSFTITVNSFTSYTITITILGIRNEIPLMSWFSCFLALELFSGCFVVVDTICSWLSPCCWPAQLLVLLVSGSTSCWFYQLLVLPDGVALGFWGVLVLPVADYTSISFYQYPVLRVTGYACAGFYLLLVIGNVVISERVLRIITYRHIKCLDYVGNLLFGNWGNFDIFDWFYQLFVTLTQPFPQFLVHYFIADTKLNNRRNRTSQQIIICFQTMTPFLQL